MAGRRVVLCVLCSRVRGARRAARARLWGSPRRPGRTPAPSCIRHLAKSQAQGMGHQLLPDAVAFPRGGAVPLLSRRLVSGLPSISWPQCPRCPPALSAIALPLPACAQLQLERPPALCLQRACALPGGR